MSTSFYFRALWARLPMRQSAFLSVLAAILLMGLLIASPVQSAAVPAPNAAAALLAWWSFDGALTDDADGYDLQTSGPPAQFIPGCQGEAAYFADNAGEYFQRPGSDAAFDFAANDYSIELLLRYDSPPSYSHEQAILEKCGGQDCTTQGWGVASLSHNAFRFFNNDGVNHIALESPRQNLVAGHWYHLAVVRQGSAASIYLDGQLIASDPLGAAALVSTSGTPLFVGRRSTSQEFPLWGALDEVKIYAGALSAGEIQAHAQQASVCNQVTPLRILVYDDYEESAFPASLREYLSGRGHGVEYRSDNTGYPDVMAEYADYDVILAIHTTGGGTLTNLYSWFQAGKGYAAMLGYGMWNDDPQDHYIRSLLGVADANGKSGEGWNPADLTWTDPAHPLAVAPNANWAISSLPWGQDRFYISLNGGYTVASGPQGAVLQTLEGVEGSGRIVVFGGNYHERDRSDPEARSLAENMVAWAAGTNLPDRAWFTSPGLDNRAAPGDALEYDLALTNRSAISETFDLSLASGWPAQVIDLAGSPINTLGPIPPMQSAALRVRVTVPVDVPSYALQTATLQAAGQANPALQASAQIVTRGPEEPFMTMVDLDRPMAAFSETLPITISVYDHYNLRVADGTPVEISATLGSVTPTFGVTSGGQVFAAYRAGSQPCAIDEIRAVSGEAWGANWISLNTSGPLDFYGGVWVITDTVWSACAGPYIVHDNSINIQSGVTLTIQAGTMVRFADATGIDVTGSLQAAGESQAPVVFTSHSGNNALAPWPGNWSGLTIGGHNDPNSFADLDHAIVAGAGLGDSNALAVMDTAANVRSSLFYQNANLGAYVGGVASFSNTTFAYNHDGGVTIATPAFAVTHSAIASWQTNWRYQEFIAPAEGWNTALAFDDAAWLQGQTPMCDNSGCATYQELEGGTVWLRTVVTNSLPTAQEYWLRVSRDDHVTVWVNGAEVFSDAPMQGGGGAWTKYMPVTLQPGRNLVAAEVRDYYGGGNHFDLTLLAGTKLETVVEGCRFEHNNREAGSTIQIAYGTPIIRQNVIDSNLNNAITVGGGAWPTLLNNRISRNAGSGVDGGWGESGGLLAVNNTLDGNAGWGIALWNNNQLEYELRNNLFTDNAQGGLRCADTRYPIVAYNGFWGPGEAFNNCQNVINAFSGDPLYLDRAAGDYHLGFGSAAIDAGDPDPQFNDPDGSRNDAGAYGGPGGESYAYVDNRGPVFSAVYVEPGAVEPGNLVTISVQAVDPSGVFSVTAHLVDEFGASAADIPLHDDGLNGDANAGDGWYGGAWPPAITGDYRVDVSAFDGQGHFSFSQNMVHILARTPVPFMVTNTDDAGPGSLRQALLDAVALDRILFDPAVFPGVIHLTSGALPLLDRGYITLDGSGLGVVVDGSALGPDASGLELVSNGNRVRGLELYGFGGNCLHISAAYNRVGGETLADRVYVGDCGNNGIQLALDAHDNLLDNVFVGTDPAGATHLNGLNGVAFYNSAHANMLQNSLVFASRQNGVVFANDTAGNTLQHSTIGLPPRPYAEHYASTLALSPAYPTDCTIYVASLDAGMLKSTDCGASWFEINNGLKTEDTGDARGVRMVFIPPAAADAQEVYAVNEKNEFFHSLDGGANWQFVSHSLWTFDVRSLVFSANFLSDRTLYAAVPGWSDWELYNGQTGVFKSSDGGLTWHPVVNGLSNSSIVSVAASPDPAAANTLFAIANSSQLYKSDNGGENWFEIALPPDRSSNLTQIAISPNYALDQIVVLVSNSGQVFRSVDGGASWQPAFSLERGDPRSITFSPHFAADQSICIGSGWNSLISCSNDGGQSWAGHVTNLPGPVSGENLATLAFSPGFQADGVLYVASVMGLARSNDHAQTWEIVRSFHDFGAVEGIAFYDNAHDNLAAYNLIGNTNQGVTFNNLNVNNNRVVENWLGVCTGEGNPTHPTPALPNGSAPLERGYPTPALPNGSTPLERGYPTPALPNGSAPLERGYPTPALPNGSAPLERGSPTPDGHPNPLTCYIPDQVIDLRSGYGNLILRNFLANPMWGGGIWLRGWDETHDNVIQGNQIGISPSALRPYPGISGNAIALENNTYHNLIGGPNPEDANIIVGQRYGGAIELRGESVRDNTVQGNFVGFDPLGTWIHGNQSTGLQLGNGTHNNLVTENVFSANQNAGIHLMDSAAYNTITNNQIGTDAQGTNAYGWQQFGLRLDSSAHDNWIGFNTISGNQDSGALLEGGGTTSNTLQSNLIGVDASGSYAIPNTYGVSIQWGAQSNLLQGNLISGNSSSNVNLSGGDTRFNRLAGNFIGVNFASIPLLGEAAGGAQAGVSSRVVREAEGEPGDEKGETGEALHELVVDAPAYSLKEVTAPRTEQERAALQSGIRTNWSWERHGVFLDQGARENIIGPDNVIAFNEYNGVTLKGGDVLSNTITQNSIYGNFGTGISLQEGANGELPAPRQVVYDLAGGLVSGTACPGCLVEVFSSTDGQGKVYEGRAVAALDGSFVFSKGMPLAGPFIVATATGLDGSTSAFSALFNLLWVDLGNGDSSFADAGWALQDLGLSYTRADAAQFATLNLAPFDVILIGSYRSAPAADYLQPLYARQADLEAFVQNGGGLVVLGQTGSTWEEPNPLDWGWLPVSVSIQHESGRVRILHPEMLIMQGLWDADFLNWWVYDSRPFTNWEADWPGAVSIVQNGLLTESALLAGDFGSGRLVLASGFFDSRHIQWTGYPVLRNLLSYAAGALGDLLPYVSETYPARGAWGAAQTGIRLRFNETLDPTSIAADDLSVEGSQSGQHTGRIIRFCQAGPALEPLNVGLCGGLLRFLPDQPFAPGETVTVTLRATVADLQGNPLDGNHNGRAEGSPADDFHYTFNIWPGKVITVTTTADNGPGSLRQAVWDAAPGDTITFDPAVFPPAAPATISLGQDGGETTLNLWGGYLTIDASNAGVILDAEYRDVAIRISSDGNVLRGLTVIHGGWTNLELNWLASFNQIGGDRSTGGGPNGQGNTFGLGQNENASLGGTLLIENSFFGNHIGVDPSGAIPWPADSIYADSLGVEGSSYHTIVGGSLSGERNLISGSHNWGLRISGSDYNLIQNNYAGLSADGLNALPNEQCAVNLHRGAQYNTFSGNLFSGNLRCGLRLSEWGTAYHTVIANTFGLGADGRLLSNRYYDLALVSPVHDTLVENNTFAGAGGEEFAGVVLMGWNNTLRNNQIGVGPNGEAWGYSTAGVEISDFTDGYAADEWHPTYHNLIKGNTIANSGVNLAVEGSRVFGVSISQNSLYNPLGTGAFGLFLQDSILLWQGANQNALPPIVLAANPAAGTASGTACPGCLVEVFSDNGRGYEGAVAAVSGTWSFNKGAPFQAADVRATATDPAGNTSEFSTPAPLVTAVAPHKYVPGAVNLALTIDGENFQENLPMTLDLGEGVQVTELRFETPQRLSALVNIAPNAPLGPRDVTFTNYDGQRGALAGGFSLIGEPPAPPTITFVTPWQMAPGVGGALRVHGQDFFNRPSVALSGDGLAVDWVYYGDSSLLWIGVTVSPTAAPGLYDLTVTNPDGQSATLPGALEIVAPQFSGSSLGPAAGAWGAAWGDADNDGDLDLFLAGAPSAFYRNQGGVLSEAAAGLEINSAQPAAAWADVDNDGDLDLAFAGVSGPNVDLGLFINDGTGNFTNQAAAWGLAASGDLESLAWADYDRDGRLDLFLAGQERSFLFHNQGDQFVEAAVLAGVDAPASPNSGVSWADYDNDRWPDLYVPASPAHLYHNNQDGTFTDLAPALGLQLEGQSAPTWGDYDNDGDLDLFVACMAGCPRGGTLYRNDGAAFTDVTDLLIPWIEPSLRSAAWGDYDNDGWLDLVAAAPGGSIFLWRSLHCLPPEGCGPDRGFVNQGLAAAFLGGDGNAGLAWGDYDNDGRLDLYIANTWGAGRLYHNELPPANHWLQVRLIGALSNTAGVGAQARLVAGGLSMLRQVNGGEGLYQQPSLPLEFGLGGYTGTLSLQVLWPSGVLDLLTVSPDQVVTVTESTGRLHDLALVDALPEGEIPVAIPFTPLVTARNLGQLPETDVPIHCRILDAAQVEVYAQDALLGPLPPALWQSVSFPAAVLNTNGVYTLECRALLPGDELPANDVFSTTLAITDQIADAWTMDNPRDDGSTPSGLTTWYTSPDLWVRNVPDGGLTHQDPIAGRVNTVYVRLRNRGNTPVYNGTVDVYWIEPSLGVRCGGWAPIGQLTFANLLPGEVRILSLPWTPTRSGHTCLQDVIDSPQDPYNRALECSPLWVPYDNNVEWHNVNILPSIVSAGRASDRSPAGPDSLLDIRDVQVQAVNIYDWPKEVDLILERLTFPLTGVVTVRLPETLFDRWSSSSAHWLAGAEVVTATQEIRLTHPISATIGAIPMTPGEEAAVGLHFEGPAGLEFELAISERIDGILTGGVAYQWQIPDSTPPSVAAFSPASGALKVALTAPLEITFSEPVGPLTLQLQVTPDPGGWTIRWNADDTAFTAAHNPFEPGVSYTVSLSAGDANGNPMPAAQSWSFETYTSQVKVFLPLVSR